MENKKDVFAMNFIFTLLLIIGIIMYPVSSFAESYVNLDKKSYTIGDEIKISGRVVYEENVPIVIQVRSISDLVAIKQFFPLKSGSFSTDIDVIGPKWTQSGSYTVIISYDDEKFEKIFSFSTNISEKNESEQTRHTQETIQSQKPKSKISISDFPDPTLSPNHYINLYNTDSDFKKLFDTSFPEYRIQEVVGYELTDIPGFPDYNLSPQYYVDRYSNEPRFRVWFDSQFPDKTIYDIVGMSEKTRPAMPSWIKQYVQLWSTGEITDSQFTSGITELIQKKILILSDDIIKTKNLDDNIPSWFKNTATWYSNETITEDDFLLGLQFLIEKKIITIQI
ncbi:hypothetical protein [Nitrosarchaeum sp. AC2]|uniref:hypothetical protein n=1 Tax=Nitrosarchaeum sp. AC2 TaxID=2259673 RepID=UPI002105427B|nr:hypothetical protein [Nitrosarchaeum sp. AC2]